MKHEIGLIPSFIYSAGRGQLDSIYIINSMWSSVRSTLDEMVEAPTDRACKCHI